MKKQKTIFMFSGQGSQYFQMAYALFETNSTFRESLLHLDAIVQELIGSSVVNELYRPGRGKGVPFERTLLTHPAIFMVEYSLATALTQGRIVPDMTLGVSLGSFAAAVCAGCISAEDALVAVVRQASALEERCEGGGMIAILAAPARFSGFLAERSELVSVSFDSHFVIAARTLELPRIEAWLREQMLAYQRLPVSFAFHSRWIDVAQASFESAVGSIRLAAGKLPLLCCASTETLTSLPEGFFWRAARRPIRFREVIANLERSECGYRYIDAGPAGTLATFLKYLLPKTSRSTVHTVLSPLGDERKNFAAVVQSCQVGAGRDE